jgi:hypothetical protein
LAFFPKPIVVIKCFQKLAVVWAKNANHFAKRFGENIFQIVTAVPGEKTNRLMHLFYRQR